MNIFVHGAGRKFLRMSAAHPYRNITSLLEQYGHLAAETNNFVEYISKIDFPTRLEKLDMTVSSINQGLQNAQQRIGDVERNVKDDLHFKTRELSAQFSSSEQNLVKRLDDLARNNKFIKIIGFILIVIIAGLFILRFVKI